MMEDVLLVMRSGRVLKQPREQTPRFFDFDGASPASR